MELTDHDLADLAAFLGRRLDVRLDETPPPADEREAARRTSAWADALRDARTSGMLSALMLRIARRHPNDANLVAAARLVTEPGHGDHTLVLALLGTAGVAAVAALTGLIAVGCMLSSGVDLSGGPVQASAVAVLDPVPGAMPVRDERPAFTGRCTRPEGGPVGWWDAGPAHPGPAGTLVPIEGRHNVRIAYPHRGNRWDTGARIACGLLPGDTVRLGEAVRVDGGRWWVPLVSGDLSPDATGV